MTQLSRRRFGALLLAGTVLAGCSTPLTPAAALSDVQLIASGLSAILPQIDPGLTAVALRISPVVADVKIVAASWDASVPLAQRLQADLGAVRDALTGITVPAQVVDVLQAAQTLLPVILAAAGLLGAAPGAGAMPVGQARAVLAAAARQT